MMYLLFLAEALEVRLVPVGVCGEEEGPHPHKAHAAAAQQIMESILFMRGKSCSLQSIKAMIFPAMTKTPVDSKRVTPAIERNVEESKGG